MVAGGAVWAMSGAQRAESSMSATVRVIRPGMFFPFSMTLELLAGNSLLLKPEQGSRGSTMNVLALLCQDGVHVAVIVITAATVRTPREHRSK